MSNHPSSFAHRYIPPSSGSVTLLLLHGTGGDENDLLPIANMLAPGAGVLSPRGKVSEHGANRFFRRLAEGVFDLEDLRLRTDELADFVRESTEHYGIDSRRVVAVGFSNGANIAASLMLTHPELLRAGVLLRAMVPFEPTTKPDLSALDVYLGEGRVDPFVPLEMAERLAAMFRERGARVTLDFQPAGHALTRADVDAASRWLQPLLTENSAPVDR